MKVDITYKDSINDTHYLRRREQLIYHLKYHSKSCDTTFEISNDESNSEKYRSRKIIVRYLQQDEHPKQYSKSITANLKIFHMSDTLRHYSIFEIELTGWRLSCDTRVPKHFMKPHFIYDESFEVAVAHIINERSVTVFDSDIVILNVVYKRYTSNTIIVNSIRVHIEFGYVVEYFHNNQTLESSFYLLYQFGGMTERSGIRIYERRDSMGKFYNECKKYPDS
ncbi:hypothetical protein RF11_13568 [Thelohanellus kitauei]|uniref:Uncharacterized protein n=1 Tax=Thelohanellus kitauei TaxID=669202 RepID=A0A0C2J5B9_THEKT|nr:hypothetical protein RF11_13568 [Thelohanellus kitauei]